AGAIIPEMVVDDQTMNALGARRDGSRRDELVARVYADDRPSRFTLYEDDGETIAYLRGDVRTTEISQRRPGAQAEGTMAAAQGSYAGAPASRDNEIDLVMRDAAPSSVTLDGEPLERRPSEAELDRGGPGWYESPDGVVRIQTGVVDVSRAKRLVVR